MSSRKSLRLRKNLKQFSKKRVDISKYVKDFYVDNGLAYISCNVKGYYDIIDPYSVKGYEWLNESFARFLESNAEYVPTEYPIVLEICGCKFTPEQKEKIEETIADYYALKMGDAQMIVEKNRNKSLVLGAFAFLCSGLLKFVTGIDIGFLREAGTVIFWFFLWEFINCACFERRDLVEERVEAAQMASIKVTFQL